MSLILIVSILVRLTAMVWSIVLLHRVRDYRMGFLTLMLALMATRQTLTLLDSGNFSTISVSGHATELPGLLVSCMAFLAVIFVEQLLAERGQVDRAIAQRSERLDLIARASRAVVGKAPLENLARDLSAQVRAVYNADACVIRTLHGDDLRLLAASGVDTDLLAPIMPARIGIASEIIRDRQPLGIEDTLTHPVMAARMAELQKMPSQFTFVSYAGGPMIVEDEVIGIVAVYSRFERRRFDDVDLSHLQTVANHVAVAIENDRLYENLRVQQRHLEQQIAERERAQVALGESEARFRTLVENAPEAIVVWDLDTGRFESVNDNAVKLFKLEREALCALGPVDVSPPIQPDGRPSADVARIWLQEALGGAKPVFEWLHRDVHQRLIPCEVRLVQLPASERHLVRGSITDITMRKAAEAEREQMIRGLAEKNAELEQFIYTVSHDLKSPLITIKGFLGELERSAIEGNLELLKSDIARIGNAANRMKQMLDELLELSRIGRKVNPPEEVPMRELTAEAVDLVSGRIRARGARVEIDENLPVVLGDRPRLLDLMQNLIDNAVKFMGNQPKPLVRVGHRRDGDACVFWVRDNGIGLDPRYAEGIFGLFDKLDRDCEGTGIGLAIARRIAEVHGGRIWVESDGLGAGATFCFTLDS